jgi:two-component system, sporulation sensor kinase E
MPACIKSCSTLLFFAAIVLPAAPTFTQRLDHMSTMIADASLIKAILDYSPECIVLIGRNHEVLAYNKTIQDVLYGYFGRALSLGDPYYPDFVVDGAKQLYLETFEKAIRGENILVQHLTENENTSIWFEYRMLPVYDEAGKLLGVSLSAKNIDQEKRAEILLKESEDKFKKITSLAPIGMIITDADLRINFSNYASQKLFEYVDKELAELTIVDLLEEFGNLENKSFQVREASLSTQAFRFDNERFTAVSKNGEKIPVLLSSSIYFAADSQYYIFLLQDISELLQKDEKISSQHKKLQEIAWKQSHVIRAPLANIMGLVSVLMDEHFSLLPAERQRFYKHLLDSAQKLDRIISDIVSSSSEGK